MTLTIEDPEALRLAQAISRITCESIPEVVVGALRERHAVIQRRTNRASVAELLAIADQVAALVKPPLIDHGELLYDEYGLPT